MPKSSQLQEFAGEEDRSEGRQDFARVVEEYRPRIFRFLLASSRDVDTAETLTQECFLKAYCAWAGFRGNSSVATWLIRIAINLQRDHWRNRRVQFWQRTREGAVDLDEACHWLPSNTSTPEEQLLAREQVAGVWKAVERLTEKQRAIFLLRFIEDLQYREIAEATGLCEGTVKAHLSHALQRVRRELKKKPQFRRSAVAA